MPTFEFNKLVRDKLPIIYERLEERITFRRLAGSEMLRALRVKLIEEAAEMPIDMDDRAKVVEELGDQDEVKKNIQALLGISDEEIETARQRKFDKKGGFSDGIFVELIELKDGDKWIDYYRKEPEKYKELDDE